jgi:glutamate-1-semialdehyde 2,1-aminomutase
MFIGHGHPEVTAAVQSQLPHGSTYFGNNRHGIALAKEIVDACRAPSRCASSAPAPRPTSTPCAAARAFRRRDKILKFEGGYHGMSDYALMSMAPKNPGNFPRAIPDSAGIPRASRTRC